MPEPKPKNGSNESSDIFRGSSNIDLAPQGLREAKLIASRTAGQFTHIASSPLNRAKDTANIVAKVNPKAGKVKIEKALEPWFLGEHEGQPVTPERLSTLAEHIKNPDKSLTGRGPKSTGDGESFNSFKNPLIGHIQSEISNFKSGEKRLSVTHYRDIHAIKAWLKHGAKEDKSIDIPDMAGKGDPDEKPGNLFHLHPTTLKLSKVEHADKEGIYLLRHGATAWNIENKVAGPNPNIGITGVKLSRASGSPIQL